MRAVLVIDVEEKDIGRKVNYVSVQGGGMSYIVGTMGYDARLRPLPQKAYGEFPCTYEYGFIDGYNKCLDEIMGETE